MEIELADLSSIASNELRFRGDVQIDKFGQEIDENAENNTTSSEASDNEYEKKKFLCFKRKIKKKISIENEERLIRLDGAVVPENNIYNGVNNQKYSILSFIPMVLFNQFKYFFNLFFLLLCISQFIPALQIGLLFSFVAPLVFVLTMTMLKEGYDDFKRYSRDKETNEKEYRVVRATGMQKVKSCSLNVGDIIEVSANQRIPADLVLLYTNDESGTVFIRTDQLDGETDWKIRKPVSETQKLASSKKNLFNVPSSIRSKGPSKLIYEFEGVYESNSGNSQPLDLSNTLWANTVLCSGKILGIVVYTGKETRMEMNSKDPRAKRGTFDGELNTLSKYLFLVMALVSVSIVLVSGFKGNFVLQALKFVLLLSGIIPISLRVNLDFSKIVFSWKISNDSEIEGAVARNSEIPEELGRVEFILSDKTGTLTQNEMVFKSLSLEHMQFTNEEVEEVKLSLEKEYHTSSGPMEDIFKRLKKKMKKKQFHRNQGIVMRDIVTAIAVCHNVTPVEGVEGEEEGKMYQASSPDEIALVKLAESLGVELEYRDQDKIVLKTPKGRETYTILENFPFSSETKRMGILVEHVQTKRLLFYLKGADSALIEKISEVQTGFVMDECENLATEGLRTLVISQKPVTPEEYKRWKQLYSEAELSLKNRKERVRKVIDLLEKNMEFLGITGVEDKLQKDVRVSIESLRNAGIKIWMLTGDKIETACCISISTNLKHPTESFFIMSGIKEKQVIEREINKFGNDINNKKNKVLVIDGTSLATAIDYSESLFFNLACRVKTVVCCRCSPTQKAYITDRIKHYTGAKTLGIGDGGNDVGMILTADVGVGIVGKEGKQAALSSDFSILRFKDLVNLLLWHGRNSYKRGAVMAQFVIHRGLVISCIQIIFSIAFYYIPIPIYNGFLLLGYGTIYTMLPVFALIFDTDVDLATALKYPPLYKSLQKGKELDKKSFMIWVWKSIYQGFVIMMMAIGYFKSPFLNLVTITFTSLIFIEMLNILGQISKFNKIMLASCLASVAVYFTSIIVFNEYLNVAAIDVKFMEKVAITVLIAWTPIALIKFYMNTYYPTEDQKLMMEANLGVKWYSGLCSKLKFWKKKKKVDIDMDYLLENME